MGAALMFILIVVICFIGILAGRRIKSAAQWANGGKNLNNGENEMQNFHISSNFHASVPVPSADGKL